MASSPGPARQLADLLVALAPVEAGRLIAVGVELHLPAAAPGGFLLGLPEQARPESPPSEIFPDPQGAHEARAAPGPPVQARHELAGLVANEDRQPAAVGAAGHHDVVPVEAVVECGDLLQARLVLDP